MYNTQEKAVKTRFCIKILRFDSCSKLNTRAGYVFLISENGSKGASVVYDQSELNPINELEVFLISVVKYILKTNTVLKTENALMEVDCIQTAHNTDICTTELQLQPYFHVIHVIQNICIKLRVARDVAHGTMGCQNDPLW